MRALLILSVAVCTLFSCIPKPLDIELEQLPPKPVIWSQVIPGSTTLVYFGKSFSALEYNEDNDQDSDLLIDQLLVADGLLTLTHNGVVDTLFKITDGLYATLSTPLIEGDFYSLYAKDNQTNESITSSTTMLPLVELIDLSAETLSLQDSSKTVKISYSFEDLPGENYYQVNYYSSINDPLTFEDPFEATGISETQLLSDLTFESSLIETSYTIDFLQFDTIWVSLSAITEEYFDYLSLRQRSGNVFTQIVQEPINYPSNIVGGYGFFNMTVPDIKMVIVDQ
jgi:hypothetical protein